MEFAGKVDGMVARNLANPTSMPVSQEAVFYARCRPVEHRTPIPEAGQRVWYRHNPHGPLTPAMVEGVSMADPGDYNVWRFKLDEFRQPIEANGKRVMEMTEDPWPDVILHTDWGRLVTREARIDGSPGWLPMAIEVAK